MNRGLKYLIIAGAVTGSIILPAIALVSRLYYQPYHVPTGAMIPSVLVGDRFYATTSIGDRPIVRGKIYCFRSPQRENVVFIKRAIAIGGDRISVEGSQVWLNGKPLAKEPLTDFSNAELNAYLTDHFAFREKVDDVEYLTLWRKQSLGQVHDVNVTLAPDEIFFLGDNRSDSWDSRFYGPVRREAIVGEPKIIWLSVGPDGVRWDRFFKKVN